jgi:hypothetical protein
MRELGYKPESCERVSTCRNGNGSDTSKMEFPTWEKLDPSVVPTSTFSFDDVMNRVPADIKIEKRDLPMQPWTTPSWADRIREGVVSHRRPSPLVSLSISTADVRGERQR